MKLEQNYRSRRRSWMPPTRSSAATRDARTRSLWTDRGAGTQISLFDAYNEYEEAEFVARQVERLVGGSGRGGLTGMLTRRADDEDGALRYGEIAICYRINAQSRVLEEAFMRFGIPYQLVGGTRFYERREVKDALAYVRLARNAADRVALSGSSTRRRAGSARRRSMSCTPGRKRAASACGRRSRPPTRTRTWRAGPHRAGQLFADIARGLMAMAGTDPPSALFDATYQRSGLQATIQDGTDDGEERWTTCWSCAPTPPSSMSWPCRRDWPASWRRALVSDQDTLEDRPDRVTLITLHAAKGLEFPIVFIVGLEEGLLPHKRALEDERELGRLRRLAYGHDAGQGPPLPGPRAPSALGVGAAAEASPLPDRAAGGAAGRRAQRQRLALPARRLGGTTRHR